MVWPAKVRSGDGIVVGAFRGMVVMPMMRAEVKGVRSGRVLEMVMLEP